MSNRNKHQIKLKSFGIIEAMVASMIVILILTSAVSLSSSSTRVANKNDAYSIASQIADEYLENIAFAKSVGKVRFIGSATGTFPPKCYNTSTTDRASADCLDSTKGKSYLDLLQMHFKSSDTSGIWYYNNSLLTDSYPNNYFSYKVTMDSTQKCYAPDGTQTIPAIKCRLFKVEVDWTDGAGNEKYFTSRYFTDWEN